MPSPLEKDEESKAEQAAKNGLWNLLKFLVKHPATWPIIALGIGGFGVYRETTRNQPEAVDAFSPDEMRTLLRREIAPLRAGIEELAKGQSDKVQVRVLQAMMAAERRNQANP